MKWFHLAICGAVLSTGMLTGVASATIITDGSLVVNIQSNGQFNAIKLNSVDIDMSTRLQEYGNDPAFFSGGSAVTAAGASASYTASFGAFDVSVTSDILGPLASLPSSSSVLRQVLTFTNGGRSAAPLQLVSYMDQDIGQTTAAGDTVAYDAGTGAVFAVDSSQLMAALGIGGVAAWELGLLGDVSMDYAGLSNNTGPVGPNDTAMAFGLDAGTIQPGGSFTMTFCYLFSTAASAVPSDFACGGTQAQVPEPGSLGMLAGGAIAMLGVGVATRRRRRS